MDFSEWQKDMIRLSVIYRMVELGEKLSTIPGENRDADFIAPILDQMCNDGYLDASPEGHWEVTPKGSEVLNRAVKALNAMEPFEILSAYNLEMALNDDEIRGADDDYQIVDKFYDPRFLGPDDDFTEQYVDLRIAMLTFLSEHQKEQAIKVDPHRIVFIRQLANGEFNRDDFWFYLRSGDYFTEVEEIVETAYRWTDLADNAADAKWYMEQIYKAAMVENIKRSGDECEKCGTPLGMFEYASRGNPVKLDECPECGHSFLPPEPEGGEEEIVETVTTTTTEEVVDDGFDDGYAYGGYYYEPCYYYDPYYMYATDVLATAIILDAVF